MGRGRADPSGKPCSTPSCLVSIPSEVGRGRARRTRCVTASPRTCCLFVSIPSEVGRGRARKMYWEGKSTAEVAFQSPRRWGGVGLYFDCVKGMAIDRRFQSPRRWGGVGLQTNRGCNGKNGSKFQSPRRWGGVGLLVDLPPEQCVLARVSIPSEVGRGRARMTGVDPQRWLTRFNPLGGGAGSGSFTLRIASSPL